MRKVSAETGDAMCVASFIVTALTTVGVVILFLI